MTQYKTKKIFFWSPMISHVGTINAVIGMAEAFCKYSKYKVYILNIFGEFNNYSNNKNFNLVNFYYPNIFINLFALFAFPYLFFKILRLKPQIFITCLVGYLPNLLKFFFKEIIIINSIQGYPQFNLSRKLIWKLFYNKSDFLITMTNLTKKNIINNINISNHKIFNLQNPIIKRSIKIQAMLNVDKNDQFIFNKKVFCAVGRLTRQKNFLELFNGVLKYSKIINNNFNLIIIGEGEDRHYLELFIKKNNIKNFYLLGFKKNPYSYMMRSCCYISTSLWEEPGHTLIEAGYLNVPILTSDCLTGPREIIVDNFNGIKYHLNDIDDFVLKLNKINNLKNLKLSTIKFNMKKTSANFTQLKFIKNFQKKILL